MLQNVNIRYLGGEFTGVRKLALYICVSLLFSQIKKNTTLPYKHLVAICLICKELLSIHHMQITKSCTYPYVCVCQAKYQVIYPYYFTKYAGAFCKGDVLILLSFN